MTSPFDTPRRTETGRRGRPGLAAFAAVAGLLLGAGPSVAERIPMRLSLDEAIAMAIRHNLDLEVARYGPEIAREERLAAWGEYDPEFRAEAGYQKREEPNTFTLNAISKLQDRTIAGAAGIEALVPYIGATVGLEFESGRTQTNSILEGFTPRYDSAAYLTARLPLARGLVWNRAWTEVHLGELGEERAVERLRADVMDVVEGVVVAYWAVQARAAQSAVAASSLQTAETLLGEMETRFEIGTVSQVEVFEARAGVAERRAEWVDAVFEAERAEDTLARALLGAEFASSSRAVFVPSDVPDASIEDVPDAEAELARAVAARPVVRLADHAIADRELELKFSRNQRLPRFDVDVRYGFEGVSGKDNVRVGALPVAVQPSPALRGGYGDSFDDLFSDSGAENLEVRGLFSVPIPNTRARRKVDRDVFRLRRAKSARIRVQQDVAFEMRDATRRVRTAIRSIAAAEERVKAADEQLRAETVRLDHGESKPFDVLLRERDLVAALGRRIDAFESYQSARARHERARGTVLEAYDIELAR